MMEPPSGYLSCLKLPPSVPIHSHHEDVYLMCSNRNTPRETKGRVQWGLFTEEGGRSLESTDSLETWQRSTVVYLKELGGGAAWQTRKGDSTGTWMVLLCQEMRQGRKWETDNTNKRECSLRLLTPPRWRMYSSRGVERKHPPPISHLNCPCLETSRNLSGQMIGRARNAVSLRKTSDLFHNNGPTLCKNACTSFPVNTIRFQKANTTERIHNLAKTFH